MTAVLVWGLGEVSACMSGTRGSGVLSSTGDVLVRDVGGVCDMCMCLARGGVFGSGGEWMRELGLGVGGLDRSRERWGDVMSV